LGAETGSIAPRLLLILAFILVNGFFAMVEIAFVSIRRTRIKQLVEEGSRAAENVQKLLESPTLFMATVQICITLVGFLASAAAAVTIADKLAALLSKIDLPIISNNALSLSVLLVTLAVGFVTLVFGEVAPKSIAMRHAEPIALRFAGLMKLLSFLMLPAVKLVSLAADLVVKPFGTHVRFSTPMLTEEELKLLVEAGEEEGVLEEEEKEMINSIFEFTDTVARQVMVPRIDMKCIEVTAELNELLETIMKYGHSRIPVYEENVDNILGVVHAKDLLPVLKEGLREVDIRDVMRPAYFIPETKKIDELLAEFKRSKIQMAIVRDEYGGTAGLVTLEDLLEEIVGDIMDEYDFEEPLIEVLDDDHAIVSARISVDDLNEQMGLEIPESEDYETIGGFVFGLFGRQPEEGESVSYGNVTFTVKSLDGSRLNKIAVERREELETETGESRNSRNGSNTKAGAE
jgi:putative hemolysin